MVIAWSQKFKGPSATWPALIGATVGEILDYLDDEFDIPDEGVNSHLKGFDEEEDRDGEAPSTQSVAN